MTLRVRSRALVLLLALAGLIVALVATHTPDAPAASAPRAAALEPAPGISPPGANDFSCEGRRGHRTPVVLVHGTFADMTMSWNLISPRLARAGYCVFALDLPRRAAAPIQRSTRKVSDFIGRVRRATDSRKVSIVGHSQGGMLPRYYIKRLDGQGKVRDLIGLSPSNHGTTTPLAPPAAAPQPRKRAIAFAIRSWRSRAASTSIRDIRKENAIRSPPRDLQ